MPIQGSQIKISNKEIQIDLLKKEIDINEEEQILLKKRIFLMQDYMSELPSYDPTWVALDKQILIDQIQLDELRRNAQDLEQRLKIMQI